MRIVNFFPSLFAADTLTFPKEVSITSLFLSGIGPSGGGVINIFFDAQALNSFEGAVSGGSAYGNSITVYEDVVVPGIQLLYSEGIQCKQITVDLFAYFTGQLQVVIGYENLEEFNPM